MSVKGNLLEFVIRTVDLRWKTCDDDSETFTKMTFNHWNLNIILGTEDLLFQTVWLQIPAAQLQGYIKPNHFKIYKPKIKQCPGVLQWKRDIQEFWCFRKISILPDHHLRGEVDCKRMQEMHLFVKQRRGVLKLSQVCEWRYSFWKWQTTYHKLNFSINNRFSTHSQSHPKLYSQVTSQGELAGSQWPCLNLKIANDSGPGTVFAEWPLTAMVGQVKTWWKHG